MHVACIVNIILGLGILTPMVFNEYMTPMTTTFYGNYLSMFFDTQLSTILFKNWHWQTRNSIIRIFEKQF